MSHEESGFKLYSLGVVAENKPIGQSLCEVILLEASNLTDGELTDRGEVLTVDMRSHTNQAVSDKVVSSVSIPAQWMGAGEGNRVTPPDVRRGEEVLVYRFSDTDKYFWEPRNTNRYLRKLETVAMAFSGTTDESDKSVTDANHYLVEVSTHKKHIVLSTSDKNGEKCRWFIQIRGGDGKLIVADNNNNEIMIDSVASVIRLINQFEAEIEISKKDINLKMPGNHTVTVQGNATINVTGSASIKAADYTLTAPTITFNGNLTVNGSFNLTGNLSSAAGGSFAGAVSFPAGHGPH